MPRPGTKRGSLVPAGAPAGTKRRSRQFSTGRSHGPVLNCLFYITGGTWRSSPSPRQRERPNRRRPSPSPPPPSGPPRGALGPPHRTALLASAPRRPLQRPRARAVPPVVASSPPAPASSALRRHPCLRRAAARASSGAEQPPPPALPSVLPRPRRRTEPAPPPRASPT